MVNGEVLEFTALPFDTVRRLKAKLAAQTGVPAHQQRLLLNTEILRDRGFDCEKGDRKTCVIVIFEPFCGRQRDFYV